MTETNATGQPTIRKKYPDGFTYNRSQTAKMLGISVAQLRRLTEQEVLAPAKMSGIHRHTAHYDANEVDRILSVGGVRHLIMRRTRAGQIGMNNRSARVESLLEDILKRLSDIEEHLARPLLREPNGR